MQGILTNKDRELAAMQCKLKTAQRESREAQAAMATLTEQLAASEAAVDSGELAIQSVLSMNAVLEQVRRPSYMQQLHS